ncbi:MAG: TRAP transporter large permease [Pseudomonadota bacterium]|nr:TRAP transporter large permease [Pseudomonadota bacterium]
MILAVMFMALVAMVLINVPIGIALAISATIGILSSDGWNAITTIGVDMYGGAGNFALIAIPMFVLAGAIMNTTGISQRLISFVSALLGFVRGGLAMVNIGVSMFFAEISGSAVADVAALGSILIPAMKKKGYSAPFSAAVTSSSASLAIIIPPSIPMILYGVMSNSSIEQLFVAGFIPGLLGGLGLMGVSYWFARRYNFPVEEAFNLKRLRRTFLGALPTFLLPIIILGGIFGGWVTATEAAGLAVLSAIVIGVMYPAYDRIVGITDVIPPMNFRDLRNAMLDGGMQTAVVMILVAASVLLGNYLTVRQVPQELAAGLLDFTSNKYVILLLLNIFFLIIGFFIHSAAAIILVVPIIIPLIEQVGINPVHFGIVVTLNLAIGQQTPPVASVLITACSIARANIWDVTKVNIYFIAVLLTVLLMTTYIPAIPMFLVDYFYGGK